MKCTDISWRAKIGSFQRSFKFKTKFKSWVCWKYFLEGKVFDMVMCTALILSLLNIGGVEMNPGPSDQVS